MTNFEKFREEYPNFVYRSYNAYVDGSFLKIKYEFEIPSLAVFAPEWTFPILDSRASLDIDLINNLCFSLGMVELISYWKATCSPNVEILPHGLNDEMISWWKALYFGGLGEFFYVNGIKTDIPSFMNIKANSEILPKSVPHSLKGNLVPVGGGKDSAVTLSVLRSEKDFTLPYVINSRGATENTCIAAGYGDTAYRARRTIDKNLIELNKKGFLNGHTPFSAIVAFSSIISAVLSGKKYVVLSNESSANESTVLGEEINHQFSKGEIFERNFIEYEKEYINSGVEYFSLLRPLSEMQIAGLFSNYEEYHKIFRSCNVGSKQDEWCCNCPKCLFVFIILSPFLSVERLTSMFGENLFEKASLLETYKELLGVLPNKPFECVGSRDEVLTASCSAVEHLKAEGKELPFLLEYFDSTVSIKHSTLSDYIAFFDSENHLPEKFEKMLRQELKEIFNV